MQLTGGKLALDNMEVLTVKDFAARQNEGKGIEPESVYYAIKHGLVDCYKLDRIWLVVMTETTKQYTPNDIPKRKDNKRKPRLTKSKAKAST